MKATNRLCAVLLLGSPILFVTHLQQPASARISPPIAEGKASLVPVDTNMHDFMEGMFQAPYRRLKEAIANEPKENNGWKAIRSDVLILAEGSNLLTLRKQEKDQQAWDDHSLASKLAGELAFKAAKKKDFAETRKAYESMIVHCNACHKQFDNGKHQLVP